MGTFLVKDIHPGPSGSSFPDDLTNVNGTLYFQANDGAHGVELWKSNGTAAGTVMVRDIDSGSSGSGPGDLTNVNGELYFTANDGVHGEELWKSDGTAGGTVMVDVFPGPLGSAPANLTNVNGTLYFAQWTTWLATSYGSRTDRTGQVFVKDIFPDHYPLLTI